jgi:hypothetical protein
MEAVLEITERCFWPCHAPWCLVPSWWLSHSRRPHWCLWRQPATRLRGRLVAIGAIQILQAVAAILSSGQSAIGAHAGLCGLGTRRSGGPRRAISRADQPMRRKSLRQSIFI